MEQEIQLEDESNTRATPNDEMKLRVKNLYVEIKLHFTKRKRNNNGPEWYLLFWSVPRSIARYVRVMNLNVVYLF